MNIVLIAGIACAIIAVIFASMYKKIDSAEKPQTN